MERSNRVPNMGTTFLQDPSHREITVINSYLKQAGKFLYQVRNIISKVSILYIPREVLEIVLW
jgi:hypothetical protein